MNTKKLHFALILLFICSSIIVLLFNFELIKLIQKDFFLKNNIRQIDSICTISINIIISIFFYYLLVYIPKIKNEINFVIANYTIINNILTDLLEIIGFIFLKYKIDNKNKKMKNENNFKNIKLFDEIFLRCKIVMQLNNNELDLMSQECTDYNFINSRKESIERNIDKLLSIPLIVYSNTAIIINLIKIRESEFFNEIDWYTSFKINNSSNCIYPIEYKSVYVFYKLINKLDYLLKKSKFKFDYPQVYSIEEIINDNEEL